MRHGETHGAQGFCGSTDRHLSHKGFGDMLQALQIQADWDVVISSPRRRCCEFAYHFARRHLLYCHIEHRLGEIHFGAWEGQSFARIQQRFPQQLKHYWRNPLQFTPPGGEPLGVFRQRVMSAWRDITAQSRDQKILVITHGGVIRLLHCELRRIPLTELLHIQVPHASMHTFS